MADYSDDEDPYSSMNEESLETDYVNKAFEHKDPPKEPVLELNQSGYVKMSARGEHERTNNGYTDMAEHQTSQNPTENRYLDMAGDSAEIRYDNEIHARSKSNRHEREGADGGDRHGSKKQTSITNMPQRYVDMSGNTPDVIKYKNANKTLKSASPNYHEGEEEYNYVKDGDRHHSKKQSDIKNPPPTGYLDMAENTTKLIAYKNDDTSTRSASSNQHEGEDEYDYVKDGDRHESRGQILTIIEKPGYMDMAGNTLDISRQMASSDQHEGESGYVYVGDRGGYGSSKQSSSKSAVPRSTNKKNDGGHSYVEKDSQHVVKNSEADKNPPPRHVQSPEIKATTTSSNAGDTKRKFRPPPIPHDQLDATNPSEKQRERGTEHSEEIQISSVILRLESERNQGHSQEEHTQKTEAYKSVGGVIEMSEMNRTEPSPDQPEVEYGEFFSKPSSASQEDIYGGTSFFSDSLIKGTEDEEGEEGDAPRYQCDNIWATKLSKSTSSKEKASEMSKRGNKSRSGESKPQRRTEGQFFEYDDLLEQLDIRWCRKNDSELPTSDLMSRQYHRCTKAWTMNCDKTTVFKAICAIHYVVGALWSIFCLGNLREDEQFCNLSFSSQQCRKIRKDAWEIIGERIPSRNKRGYTLFPFYAIVCQCTIVISVHLANMGLFTYYCLHEKDVLGIWVVSVSGAAISGILAIVLTGFFIRVLYVVIKLKERSSFKMQLFIMIYSEFSFCIHLPLFWAYYLFTNRLDDFQYLYYIDSGATVLIALLRSVLMAVFCVRCVKLTSARPYRVANGWLIKIIILLVFVWLALSLNNASLVIKFVTGKFRYGFWEFGQQVIVSFLPLWSLSVFYHSYAYDIQLLALLINVYNPRGFEDESTRRINHLNRHLKLNSFSKRMYAVEYGGFIASICLFSIFHATSICFSIPTLVSDPFSVTAYLPFAAGFFGVAALYRLYFAIWPLIILFIFISLCLMMVSWGLLAAIIGSIGAVVAALCICYCACSAVSSDSNSNNRNDSTPRFHS